MAKGNPQNKTNGSNLDFEAQLWAAADKMRGHMDASEYKHVALGLIFLKYISDAFEEKRTQLLFGFSDPKSDWYIKEEPERKEAAENRDEYLAANVFWLPPEARWHTINAKAKSPEIGKVIDDAMGAIERENPTLKGVLPRDYARPSLDKVRLGGLVDIISNIGFNESAAKSKDVLGRVYEYFLGKFASAEGKGGGEFYTPQCVVQLLVHMIEPYKGRVYDPACGSGGMFVSSEKFVEEHSGRVGDIAVYGQESNYTTWKLARMNLAIRGLDANLGPRNADSFRADLHPDLKADFILANPPFNMSDWGGENLRQDVRWKFGMPPVNNANYAWIQHFIHHLSPVGVAGFVMANGSMSTQTSNEGEIRKALIEADLVDCMVALPGHLFYSMYSQVCLWFLTRTKTRSGRRDRRGETLFIDARDLGVLVDRTHRELITEDINKIVQTYHSWAHQNTEVPYQDVLGFCRKATIEEIRKKSFSLSPARYVGSEAINDNDEPPQVRISHLIGSLATTIAESKQRNERLIQNLSTLGFESNLLHPEKESARLVELDAVELNLHLNGTLNEITKLLFRSWFVDFDPVRAKSEVQIKDLPKNIAELFPNEFEESELGEIPKGWRVAKYAEILRPTGARIGEVDAPEYSATVRGLELRDLRFNKQLAKAQTKNKRIQKNDLVFGLSRKVLNFGLMTEEIGSVSGVYEIFQIDTQKYVPKLLELYIRYHMKLHIEILKPGAREGQPIDRDYLLSKEVMIPDFKVQQAFESIVRGNLLPIAK